MSLKLDSKRSPEWLLVALVAVLLVATVCVFWPQGPKPNRAAGHIAPVGVYGTVIAGRRLRQYYVRLHEDGEAGVLVDNGIVQKSTLELGATWRTDGAVIVLSIWPETGALHPQEYLMREVQGDMYMVTTRVGRGWRDKWLGDSDETITRWREQVLLDRLPADSKPWELDHPIRGG